MPVSLGLQKELDARRKRLAASKVAPGAPAPLAENAAKDAVLLGLVRPGPGGGWAWLTALTPASFSGVELARLTAMRHPEADPPYSISEAWGPILAARGLGPHLARAHAVEQEVASALANQVEPVPGLGRLALARLAGLARPKSYGTVNVPGKVKPMSVLQLNPNAAKILGRGPLASAPQYSAPPTPYALEQSTKISGVSEVGMWMGIGVVALGAVYFLGKKKRG